MLFTLASARLRASSGIAVRQRRHSAAICVSDLWLEASSCNNCRMWQPNSGWLYRMKQPGKNQTRSPWFSAMPGTPRRDLL